MQAETNISEFLAYGPIEHSSDLQLPCVNPVKHETERQKIEGHTRQTAWYVIFEPGRCAVLTVEEIKDTLVIFYSR
jgi:hypothetical protein